VARLWEWLECRGCAVTLRVKEGDHKLTLRARAGQNAEVTIVFSAKAIRRQAEYFFAEKTAGQQVGTF
jgi:hypothetical protein